MQLQYLIANNGERAISNVIEPLRLDLPQGAQLLDVSVLHQSPKNLQATIQTKDTGEGSKSVFFQFPLLNKGDFFLVKLLISGKVHRKDIVFKILADDLPRSISSQWLSPGALEERKYHPEWGAAVGGLICLGVVAWFVWVLGIVHEHHSEMFPIPWTTYSFTIRSIALLLPVTVICLLFSLIGLLALGAAACGGEFPPTTTRFPLPKELRRHSRFFYRGVPPELIHDYEEHIGGETTPKSQGSS